MRHATGTRWHGTPAPQPRKRGTHQHKAKKHKTEAKKHKIRTKNQSKSNVSQFGNLRKQRICERKKGISEWLLKICKKSKTEAFG